jgi:hypothetical protein
VSAADYERTKQIDRTKTGVLLLLVGTLLSWVPLIGVIGYLLIFIGVILVILGRKAFGRVHARNAVLSVVIFVVGIIALVVVALIALWPTILASISAGGTLNPTPAFYASAQNAALLGSIAAAVVVGLAELLFTYALQATAGRMFLWAAYGANLALSVAIYLILSPVFGAVVSQADLNNAAAQLTTYQLMNVVPAMLFVAADYLAWSRISRGEIPARPGMPSAVPPAMPPSYPRPSPPTPPQQPPQAPPPSGPAPPTNP